ncbi:MAG: site-specific integrase [Micromonosporaceae bacterium]|nr:site-specific integrase [Micromonosporaceae bacterium]
MPVDDLWYLRARDPNNTKKRLPSKKHGRGKRWRVRYVDASGEGRERLFERKTDAEAFDLQCRAGVADAVKVDRGERRVTFREYAERWRRSRQTGWAEETVRRMPGNLGGHLYPAFGNRTMRSITLTDVLEWISGEVEDGTALSSIKLYFELLKTIMQAAVIDRVISESPCTSVKLSQVLRGLSRAPKWVPNEDQVLAMVNVVPEQFTAAIWLGAGQGLRLGEVLGMEDGLRCADAEASELHVVQQLRRSKKHGGYCLAPPKSGSSGTIDLDPMVAEVLAAHTKSFPPVAVRLVDTTGPKAVTRSANLLFTGGNGRPLDDSRWSLMWAKWRVAAGWPAEGTFHSLRHFFATTLMSNGVDPQDVQKALRHASLRITLETYVHWLPKRNRPRGVIGTVLSRAATVPQQRGSAGAAVTQRRG